MATILDLPLLLSPFSSIFVFILTVLFIGGLLMYTKWFGNNQMLVWAVAFIIGVFVAMSPVATLVIQKVAPVFAVVLVFVMILSVVSTSMTGGSMPPAFQSMKYIVMVIIVVALVAGSLSVVRDHVDVPETGEDFDETSTVFFHPNFLGIILFFLIAIFTIGLLSARSM